MDSLKLQFQEIDASEASVIYGGEPTTETSLAYDIGWVIGFSFYCKYVLRIC